jgi:hypothetical protein
VRRWSGWRSECGGALRGRGRRSGKAGEAGRRRGRPAAARPGEEGLEVGDGPHRWAPPVGGCVREREGRGRWWAGVGRKRGIGPRLEKEKEGGEDGLGRRGERVSSLFLFFCFFSFHFFSNPFQTNFPTIFKSNLLYLFKFKF